jgi:hypothetical protein
MYNTDDGLRGLRVGALSDLQVKDQSVLDKDSSGNSDGGCGGSGIVIF